MPARIPNTHSETEIRQAFQRLAFRSSALEDEAVGAGQVLVTQVDGLPPTWTTALTALTLLTVDNITINGATITSDTGAISFSNENLSTTGIISGVNVTSGADPGHTHTAYIPYAGATGNVDLGAHDLTTTGTISGVNVTSGADPGHTHAAGSIAEADPIVGAITGLVKADGAGNISAAVAGIDYLTPDGDGSALTDLTWGQIGGTPTTLAGYGISDTKANFDVACSDGAFQFVGDAPTAHTIASHSDTTATGAELDTLTDGSNADLLHEHAWSVLTGTPTTLAGYGITDVQPLDADLTAIAALAATGGWAKRTAADTWEISTPSAADVGADPAGTAATAVSDHETTYDHDHYDTAYGWGDHSTEGYLTAETDPIVGAINGLVKADGGGNISAAAADTDYLTPGTASSTYVPYTGATSNVDLGTKTFTTTGQCDLGETRLAADSRKLYFGAGNDAAIYYDGSHMVFDSRVVGGGDFMFQGGHITLPANYKQLRCGPGNEYSVYWSGNDAVHTVTSGDIVFLGGNIGVRTDVPAWDIHVKRSQAYTTAIYVENPSGANLAYAGYYAKADLARLEFQVRSSGTPGLFDGVPNANMALFRSGPQTDAFIMTTGKDAPLYLATNDLMRLRITGSGSVEILTDNLNIVNDNKSLVLGAGGDASLSYDGTNLVIDPKVVGSGHVDVQGEVHATSFTGANVTSGSDPGHTHTGYVSAISRGEVYYFNTTGQFLSISAQSDGSTNMVHAGPASTLANAQDFDNGGSNDGTLRYTGSTTRYFAVSATVSYRQATGGSQFVWGLAKNGSVITNSKVLNYTDGTNKDAIALQCIVELAQYDHVRVYAGNMSDTDNFYMTSLNLRAVGM